MSERSDEISDHRQATTRRALLTAALLLPLAGCTTRAPQGVGEAAATSRGSEPPPPPAPPTAASAGPLVPVSVFADLEARAAARLGLWAVDTATGRKIRYRPDERFAMCSTFKALAAGAVLQRNELAHLDTRVTYDVTDLVPYSPVTEQNVTDGMTIRELCDAAVRYSDNAAANLLLADLGGPQEVTAFLRSIGDTTTRLDRIEPDLNEATPGDPRDTTTPAAIGRSYQALVLGDALLPDRRAVLSDWLRRNTTGDARIRAGVPAGWTVGDKTGTGRYGSAHDIAVLWPPASPPLVLAVMTDHAAADAEADESLIVAATRTIIDAFA